LGLIVVDKTKGLPFPLCASSMVSHKKIILCIASRCICIRINSQNKLSLVHNVCSRICFENRRRWIRSPDASGLSKIQGRSGAHLTNHGQNAQGCSCRVSIAMQKRRECRVNEGDEEVPACKNEDKLKGYLSACVHHSLLLEHAQSWKCDGWLGQDGDEESRVKNVTVHGAVWTRAD
jgi:hypothetical protein